MSDTTLTGITTQMSSYLEQLADTAKYEAAQEFAAEKSTLEQELLEQMRLADAATDRATAAEDAFAQLIAAVAIAANVLRTTATTLESATQESRV